MTASTLGTAPACVLCGATVPGRRLFSKGGWDFVRCPDCRLVSIHPLPSLEALQRHHDESYASGGYAQYAAAETIRTAIARHRLDVVRPLAPAGAWLDVGCSTGSFLAAATSGGIVAEGLEMSAPAVAHARARGLRVHEGSVERFEPQQRYAAVTGFDVVEHLRDPLAFVRRAASWLVPGGVLALTVPNIRSLSARLMGRFWFYYVPPDHLHYFTPATIARLLENAELADVRIRPAVKPLSLGYGVETLARFNPALGRVAVGLVRCLPSRAREQIVHVRVGEMWATGRRRT